MGTAATVFALAAVAIAPITASTSGMMTAPIQMQARRPLPPHKLRMLFGEDHEGYRRFLEESAPPSRAIAANGSTGSPPEADLPLHAGYGTHYAFVFVGTPAQRVSVILDTGSHWTAFPCTGCQMCGDDHTDPVFDVLKSDTFHALDCSECKFSGHCKDNKCSISLAYAEGSRWDAYEVRDTLFLGGDSPQAPVRGGQDLSMPFVFGCQTYETGLFRTQLENGIMGLSFQDLTIVPKLREAGKIDATVFSLCFTEDGGSMRIGKEAGQVPWYGRWNACMPDSDPFPKKCHESEFFLTRLSFPSSHPPFSPPSLPSSVQAGMKQSTTPNLCNGCL